MRSKKILRLGAALAALALAATACGDSDDGGDEGASGGGTLTVCSEIPYPPFEFEADDGSFTGFDIEMIQAIGEELGREVEIVNTGFEGIQSGASLEAGTCDVAVSAMTITEDREENLDFSEPYFDADQSLLVKADAGISTLADLSGMSIGVQSETTGAAYAEENKPDDATITEFSSGADAISALQAGQVDAVLQDLGPNGDAVSNDDTLAIAETYETDESYGMAVAEEGSEDLLEDLNEALQTLRDNGTYDEIFQKYFPGA
jgi:polar amino acid transport system substrate-binding protein